MSKQKQYSAEAEVVKINERDLPRRLGLLLRNGEGVEKWFSMWRGDEELPALEEGEKVRIVYVQKPGKNGGPFLNIIELEKIGDQSLEEDVNEEVLAHVKQDLGRQVSIRAAVALKAAAVSGLAKDRESLFSLADACFLWLLRREKIEVAKLTGEEVIEDEGWED